MQNRTVAIAITVVTALCCLCLAIMSCVWGGLIASGQPITSTVNGVETVETLPAPLGFALICLSLIFVLIPVVVGFLTLRKKPEEAAVVSSEPVPPAA